MKKKIISLGALVISFSLIVTLTCATSSKTDKTDISVASIEELKAGNGGTANKSADFNPDFYVTEYGDVIESNDETVAPTQSSGGSSGGLLGNIANNGGSLLSPGSSGGLVDAFGNIVGGILTPQTQPPATAATAPYISTTASIITGNTLIPVPAASQTSETETTAAPTVPAGETVDYAATANPYTKPTSDFKAGDRDDTIKWIQWIFIYTRYGLKDNGITGRLDEDTVAVVKKLQQEKGLTVDGNINQKVVDEAELLYLEYTLGADTTARYIEPSAAETLAPPTDNTTEKNTPDILPIIIIISVLWIVTVVVVFAIFIIKKKKLAKEIEKSEESEATTKKDKEEKNTSGVMSMSDLFEDAGKK